MRNIEWQIWIVITIGVLSIIAALTYDKKGSSKQLGETAKSIFSMLLSSLWLPLWVFVQWIVGQILKVIPVDIVDQTFLSIFRYLFGGVTLIFVLIEVTKSIIVAFKNAQNDINKNKPE
jgi:hypothetical protein